MEIVFYLVLMIVDGDGFLHEKILRRYDTKQQCDSVVKNSQPVCPACELVCREMPRTPQR